MRLILITEPSCRRTVRLSLRSSLDWTLPFSWITQTTTPSGIACMQQLLPMYWKYDSTFDIIDNDQIFQYQLSSTVNFCHTVMGCFPFPHQAAQTSGTGKLMTHVTPVNTNSRCQHICHSLTSASSDVQKSLAAWYECSTSMTLHARYTLQQANQWHWFTYVDYKTQDNIATCHVHKYNSA